MITYDDYKKVIEQISYEKKILNDLVKKLKEVRKEYMLYLKNNPYRKDFFVLMEKVNNQRDLIIEKIPADKWK